MANVVKNYSFLLSELVKKGIRLKYRRSYLGILWSLIEPILSTIILVIVFGTLFKNDNPTYPMYILIGRLFFTFFTNGTCGCCRSIRDHAGMLTKVYVPKLLYPLSNVLYNFIIFAISLIVMVGVDIFCKIIPSWSFFMFIPALVILLLLTFGVGLFLATLNIFFRDIEYLWNVLLTIIMYMSAIFYYPDMILQSRWAFVLKLNPLYQVIDMARSAVMNLPFNYMGILYSFVFGIVMTIISLLFYNSQKEKFILHL